MGYSVYYTGEIAISPDLTEEHESLLADALPSKTDPLGISREESSCIYHGCNWQFDDAQLSIEGESRRDLAAQVRALNDALQPFAEVPVEECA
jgi:hypothetical protein